MANAAKVYIIEIPYHADKPYDYYIPSDAEDIIVPGMMIEVPFGNGNRKMAAVVYDVTEVSDAENLKPVITPSDRTAEPVLNREMLDLCLFVKNYTLCTYGEALKSVLPSAAMSRIAESYRINDDIDDGRFDREIKKLSEKAAFVFAEIKAKGHATKEYLRSVFGEECAEILANLIKCGLVVKDSSFKRGGSNVKYELHVYPSEEISVKYEEDSDTLEETLAQMKSIRQAAVLKAAVQKPGITDREISSLCGIDIQAVKSSITALEKKSYVTKVRQTVYRNPFSPENYDGSYYNQDYTLSQEQSEAYKKLLSLYESPSPKAALLHGVTGSGKTNVIMHMIDRVVSDGRGVIMLVPEIALTSQTVGKFTARYGGRVAVIHSALSSGERFDAFRRIKSGDADIVIGTRSAIFAPVPKIGLIVIDEEHEHTYKSDTNPKYYAHDVARYRCGEHGAMMLLASATPSVTSYYKAVTGTYTLVELKNRYGAASLPDVEICDMRAELAAGNTSPLSRRLIELIGNGIKDGKQSILFLNRRGYNNYVSCRSCGTALKCPHCSVTMTYHVTRQDIIKNSYKKSSDYLEVRKNAGILRCHMCGYRTKVPDKCPDCSGEHFLFMGYGTQLAENELEKLFPGARVVRMDHDTTQGKHSHEELLTRFRDSKADILLGTQMVTKGHDFPNVTTVGVINADSSMFLDDYRASERTFSMLTQVAGRAGRGDSPGVSVIQTYNPGNDIIALAAAQDYRTFYEREIKVRKALVFPPFCDIAVITLSSSDEAFLAQSGVRLSERIREHIRNDYTDVKAIIYGPFEAPVYKVQNVCRLRFVIKCKLNKRTRAFISDLICEFSKSRARKSRNHGNLRISADLNPTSI